jgi:hypothetical protein
MHTSELEPVDVAYARKLEERGLPSVPTKKQYVVALRQLDATINDDARRMLLFHSKAPSATATAEDIALACGRTVSDDQFDLWCACSQPAPCHRWNVCASRSWRDAVVDCGDRRQATTIGISACSAPDARSARRSAGGVALDLSRSARARIEVF